MRNDEDYYADRRRWHYSKAVPVVLVIAIVLYAVVDIAMDFYMLSVIRSM